MKQAISLAIVSVIISACATTVAVQPTPQIIYVTPAPTLTPVVTARPTLTPTEAPTADVRAANLVAHILNSGSSGSKILGSIAKAIGGNNSHSLKSSVQDLLDWSLNEGMYLNSVDIPPCANELADQWYKVISNFGASAIAVQTYLGPGGTLSDLDAATELMSDGNAAVKNLNFSVCGMSGSSYNG